MASPQGAYMDPYQIPGLAPLPGVIPDFDDPYTRGPMLLALTAVAIGIMFLFVLARFYCKIWIHRKLTWDDLEKAGLGTHQWNLRAIELAKDSFLKVGPNNLRTPNGFVTDHSSQPLYILVNIQPIVELFMKLSFHIYFLQIFGPKPILRWSIWIGGLVTTIFYITTFVLLFVLSTPGPGETFAEEFAKYATKKSSPVLNTTLAVGYFNVFSDLYLLILPIWGVMGLNLRKKRKIGVILMFMTGLLALGSSSASLYFRYAVNHSGDTTWNLMPAAYLLVLELSVGVNCSCMPLCVGGIRRHLPFFNSIITRMTSFFHDLGSRLSPRGGTGYLHLFGYSKSGQSSKSRSSKQDADSDDTVGLKSLPKVSEGFHEMRTARAFIARGEPYSEYTIDDEEKTLRNSSA
ncbi:MAG: hypothetical protein Q9220_003632 [cf. Caloplaca sp. 1 TL-2023]